MRAGLAEPADGMAVTVDGEIHLRQYIRWRKKTGLISEPQRIIDECLNGTGLVNAEHAKAIKRYCEDSQFARCKRSSLEKQYRTVRSFYAANLVSLPRIKLSSGNAASSHVVQNHVTATDFLEMVRKALNSATKLRDKSLIMVMVQSGMDDSTLTNVFNYYGYPQLVSHFATEDWRKWDVSKCPVMVRLVRPKTNYEYYTFLDVDAIALPKDYLDQRCRLFGRPIRIHPPESPTALPRSDPIYVTSKGKSLRSQDVSKFFTEAGKRAGVNVEPSPASAGEVGFRGAGTRYPFHSHGAADLTVHLSQKEDMSPWRKSTLTGRSFKRNCRPLRPSTLEGIRFRATAFDRVCGCRALESAFRKGTVVRIIDSLLHSQLRVQSEIRVPGKTRILMVHGLPI